MVQIPVQLLNLIHSILIHFKSPVHNMQLMAVGDGRHDLPEVLPGPALLQPPLVLHDVVIPAVGTLQSIMFSSVQCMFNTL